MDAVNASDQRVVRVDHAVATSPDVFAAKLAPVASGVRAESQGGEGFRADLYAANLRQLGLFTVRLRDGHVERGPQPYAAVTVPASRPLDFYRQGLRTTFYSGSAHLLHTCDLLDLRIHNDSGMFVGTFEEQWLDSAARRLTGYRHFHDLHDDWHLDLETSTGRSFRHFLDFIWAETCRGGQFTRSELAVREIENTCTTLLILASESTRQRRPARTDSTMARSSIDIAEEYLRANLTEPYSLDKLIAITGASASTLSREFRRRHGIPPLQFLKLRRLDAARRELLSAEPDSATVTAIATTYGFYHLGRFTRWYRECFGERPSETLRRRS